MHGAGLRSESVAESGAGGGVAGLWVRRLVSTISWRRFGGLRKVTEAGFGEEVLGRWIRGEDVEAFSKDPYELV